MKSYKVRVVTDVLISFDDDRATSNNAQHVAEDCLGLRARIGDTGISEAGRWIVEPVARVVQKIKEVEP